VLYVPDIEPGLALKTLARLADRIALTAPEAQAFFPHHRGLVVTGYPVRSGLARWTRTEARRHFGLPAEAPVLLVFGGSKGARSINRAVLGGLQVLLPQMHLVHLTGRLDWEEVARARAALPETLRARYRAFPYLHDDMGAALAAADLVVSRAGASVLGEFPLFGLPAVLVPYPYAWRYQRVNAAYLADRGAARILPDEQLAARFVPLVQELMAAPDARARMAAAMRALARPDAARRIAAVLHEAAGEEVPQ
jgi:UDP-N-acetylglucosamine--N-acetylmuramyl-(pentapeptide) pyrophosphoryl-undecaprenol N-acetylglucosamine transferase